MTNQEILEKAIQKAIDGGWYNANHSAKEWGVVMKYIQWQPIIYSHDFAKALWGEENAKPNGQLTIHIPNWYHHLQMMIVAKDPIKYLGENL